MINAKQDILNRVNTIANRIMKINKNSPDSEITNIRLDILSLIEDIVKFYSVNCTFDTWAKDSLAGALSDIRWNLGKGKGSIFMLRACRHSI